MELEADHGSKLVIAKDQKAVFGRGNGFSTTDPTVSRRHVLLKTEPTVSFEVLGRNPIWVRSHEDGAVRVFRRSEKGELADGDWLCVSGKRPVWYRVRNVEGGKRVLESEMAEVLGNGSESEDFDVSGIDLVKDFGFIAMGHEFDQYPKQMIRHVKNWNWFLEEPRKESDDYDESKRKERRGRRSKRKKGEENEDDDWTGESEADEEIAKLRNVSNPKYSTRLKASSKPQKDTKVGTSSVQRKTAAADEEDMEDDDETLGGFIVGEDDLDEEDLEETDEYEEEEEEEEEEEFVEDD